MSKLYEFLRIFLTTLHIYWIGFSYSVYEFFSDKRWSQFLVVKAKTQHEYEVKIIEKWEECMAAVENLEPLDYQRVAVITGADGTIGVEILELLTAMNFFSICVGLHRPNADDAATVKFLQCDLRDATQIKNCAKSIRTLTPNVDLLVCAAGVMFSRQDPCDAIEPHLAVNVLAHALLFGELRAQMEASSWRSPKAVFLSSSTCHAGSIAEYLTANETAWRRQSFGYKSYADSKLLLSLYVNHLGNSLRREESNIYVASVHPGVVPGRLYRNVFWLIRFFINTLLAPFLRTGRLAAIRVLNLTFSENLKNGSYFEDGEPPVSLLNQLDLLTIDDHCSTKVLEELGRVVENWIEKFVE